MLFNVVMNQYLTLSETAELLGKNKETLRRWDREGKLVALREPISNYRVYKKAEVLELFSEFMFESDNNDHSNYTEPIRDFKLLELFAGAGGLAIGLEQAGLDCVALNEIDKYACATLRKNRPEWNVLEGDIKNFDFTEYNGKVDVVGVVFHVKRLVMQEKNLDWPMPEALFSLSLPEL